MKLDQHELEDRILNGTRHTFADLCDFFDADETQAMQIDRTLQKLRRNGKIKMRRDGRTVYWKALPQFVAPTAN